MAPHVHFHQCTSPIPLRYHTKVGFHPFSVLVKWPYIILLEGKSSKIDQAINFVQPPPPFPLCSHPPPPPPSCPLISASFHHPKRSFSELVNSVSWVQMLAEWLPSILMDIGDQGGQYSAIPPPNPSPLPPPPEQPYPDHWHYPLVIGI